MPDGTILGLDDGLVTTLLTVMTVSGVIASPSLLKAMIGVVLAGTISMTLGGYAEARTKRAYALTRTLSIRTALRIHPIRQGIATGSAFLVGGLVPLLPVALGLPDVRLCSYGCTAFVALGFGLVKARYTDHHTLRSALFFLAIVTAGTLAGYAIGLVL